MTKTPAHEALERFARRAGFEKKAGTWYRVSDGGVIAIVDLQKSQYGMQYYVNLGFWFQELGAERYPKPQQSHVSIRLETLAPDERQRIARLLDLEQDIPDAQRHEELLDLLTDRLELVIERADSVVGVRGLVEDGPLRAAAIRGPAARLLEAGDL